MPHNRHRRGDPQLPLDYSEEWAEELRLLIKAERLWRAGLNWHDHYAFDTVRRPRRDTKTIHPNLRYL